MKIFYTLFKVFGILVYLFARNFMELYSYRIQTKKQIKKGEILAKCLCPLTLFMGDNKNEKSKLENKIK